MLWTWNFARTFILIASNIWECLTKITSLLTELWHYKSEKWRIFSHFCRDSSLACSTSSIMMKFSQVAYFVDRKHLTKFQDVADLNYNVTSKFDDVISPSKWQKLLKTLQNLLLCHNDVLCRVSSIFVHPFFFMKIPFLWKQQKTANTDAVVYVFPRQRTQSMIF